MDPSGVQETETPGIWSSTAWVEVSSTDLAVIQGPLITVTVLGWTATLLTPFDLRNSFRELDLVDAEALGAG